MKRVVVFVSLASVLGWLPLAFAEDWAITPDRAATEEIAFLLADPERESTHTRAAVVPEQQGNCVTTEGTQEQLAQVCTPYDFCWLPGSPPCCGDLRCVESERCPGGCICTN